MLKKLVAVSYCSVYQYFLQSDEKDVIATWLKQWLVMNTENARGRVLDIGAGSGQVISRLPSSLQFDVVEPNQVFHPELAKIPGVDEIYKMTIQQYLNDTTKRFYDVVLASHSLCHISQAELPVLLLGLLYRLAEQGVLIIVTNASRSGGAKAHSYYDFVRAFTDITQPLPSSSVLSFPNESLLMDLFKKEGYQVSLDVAESWLRVSSSRSVFIKTVRKLLPFRANYLVETGQMTLFQNMIDECSDDASHYQLLLPQAILTIRKK